MGLAEKEAQGGPHHSLPAALEIPHAQTEHWLFVITASQFQNVEAASGGR